MYALLVSAALVGCQPSSESSIHPTREKVVLEVLIQALDDQVKSMDSTLHVEASKVSRTYLESSVIDDLTYWFATYNPPDITHASHVVAAGELDGKVQMIKGAQDWLSISAGWQPTTPTETINACKEIYIALNPRVALDASFFQKDSVFRSFFEDEIVQINSRLEPPEANRASDGAWSASFWLVRPYGPRGAVKYRCTIPFRSDSRQTMFTALDSIVFPAPS